MGSCPNHESFNKANESATFTQLNFVFSQREAGHQTVFEICRLTNTRKKRKKSFWSISVGWINPISGWKFRIHSNVTSSLKPLYEFAWAAPDEGTQWMARNNRHFYFLSHFVGARRPKSSISRAMPPLKCVKESFLPFSSLPVVFCQLGEYGGSIWWGRYGKFPPLITRSAPLATSLHPYPQMLSGSHVLHTTKDPFIVLVTEDILKALGAQCRKRDKDPIYTLLVVSHNITNNLGEGLHLLKVFTENSFTLGECGREGSIGLNR